ncbi:MAG: ABC transporter ATP-binding protein [Bdellovibrionaceae bacterium]|nr:ABC transporter ATP-binding protein [Bdellovibrionales bacterium]MCB9253687.1 ABC transporter ATP-binding protein [Pseudobdellovibrionaceae bacterium]
MAPILDVRNLKAHFHTRRGVVRAVDGIGFSLEKGETLGIVGESGSGKSVTQLSILGLLPTPPLKIESGEALFGGMDLLKASPSQLRSVRGNKISMIFQEPMTSLNPYLKVGTQLVEPLVQHRNLTKKEAWAKAVVSLEKVGIADAKSAMNSYPHEFSGGMRQRVMIAMALTTDPELLIADEPTTALDVTVQAQILDLLKSLQKETGMAIILITHDLGVVAGMADRVLVMYAGKAFEYGTTEDIFYRSQHPYTSALLRSTPRLDTEVGSLPPIGGSPPDLMRLTGGCPFYERCSVRLDDCKEIFPEVKTFANTHRSYCHLKELPQ